MGPPSRLLDLSLLAAVVARLKAPIAFIGHALSITEVRRMGRCGRAVRIRSWVRPTRNWGFEQDAVLAISGTVVAITEIAAVPGAIRPGVAVRPAIVGLIPAAAAPAPGLCGGRSNCAHHERAGD